MEKIGLWPNTVLLATAFKDNSKFDVTITSTEPVGSGGTSSVIQGKSLAASGLLNTFALKVFNVAIDPAEKQRLLRELKIVQQLGGQHRHILHYIGSAEFADRSALNHVILVSPYMKHGNLLSYIRRNPTADRLTFIIQVADAVAYLHSRHGLVHGDLKCENVLVSDDICAVLADFGLSTVIEKEDVDEVTVSAIREAFSPRFAAPEILVDAAESPSGIARSKTPMSDVYAFGMLIVQAFSGEKPWPGLQHPQYSYHVLVLKQFHPRPQVGMYGIEIDDGCWKACLSCWAYNPEERPTIQAVRGMLSGFAAPEDDTISSQAPQINPKNVQVKGISRDTILTGRSFKHSQPFTVTNISVSDPIGHGTTAIVYRGDACLSSGRIVSVAIKVFAHHPREIQLQLELYRREIQLVTRVRHSYLLPFFGEISIGQRMALVAPFMSNGTLEQYIKRNQVQGLCTLIRQVAEAVEYLHVDEGIVHGDLRCEKVLISDKGDALLTDFRLGTLQADPDVTTATAIRHMGSIPHTAPEIFLDLDKHDELVYRRPRSKTTQTDIYAFAMLIVMAFAKGNAWNRTYVAVIQAICSGLLPRRPNGLSDAWWKLCAQCLSFEPESRPTIKEVRRRLTKDVDGFEDFDEWF